MAVVMIDEDAKNTLEVRWAENQKPIETLRTDGSHEPLRHAVSLRRPKWRPDDLNPVADEYPVKAVCEFLVPVANQEADGWRASRHRPG
jgi:hypothetical protein